MIVTDAVATPIVLAPQRSSFVFVVHSFLLQMVWLPGVWLSGAYLAIYYI